MSYLHQNLTDECTRLKRQLERERTSRAKAEAIAEKRLRELYAREQQLQLIARIATAANQSQSVRDVFQFALTQICEFTDWPVGHCYMTVPDAGAIRLRSMAIWHATNPDRIAGFKRVTEEIDLEPGSGLSGRVFAEQAPAWFFDVTTADNFPRIKVAKECGLKAAYGFPVMLGDEVAAVLEFFTDKAIERDETLLELMSRMGMQLGRVIERERANDRLIHDASHDALTNLPNRVLFLDRLNQTIARHVHKGAAQFAVLFIDLDRFKIVNDSLGHLAGDDLIVQVARRLKDSLRRNDRVVRARSELGGGDAMLARLGGDEFTILLSDIQDPSDAVRVASRVQEALRQPFTLEEQKIYTSASIGIASSKWGYSCADDILRDADLAMYRAKALGKARTELYDQDLHSAAVKRLMLESDLRRALANNEFVLHYQPIVSLGTQEIVGFEALVRWQKPNSELVYPGEFIDVTEDTGLIVFLGLWVLRTACNMARRLQEEFPRRNPLTISINISPRQFAQPDLVAQVRQIVTETGIDPRTVRLEITESVTAGEAERVVRVLSQLKDIGIRLSIDDFGTGYSSLSYLQRFPLDVLKIDRSFISAMDKSESLQIVRTIMGLARSLGMSVVAEGTELRTQVSQLKSLGCEFGQGYFFSKPVDATAIRNLLVAPLPWTGPEEAPSVVPACEEQQPRASTGQITS
ncbi:MAG: EAL domain-containing protein [Bradyrhizobium sp.]|nr:EAL domain-containing protein [Pseudomonadota bacterium]MDE2471071.1 EAL domain-containing protein [Bradyrhizobium sp.]